MEQSRLENVGPQSSDDELLEIAASLSSQRDLRGELMRLQIQWERSKPNLADVRRVKALLRDEVDALLGPLAPFVLRSPLYFHKGFVDVAEVRDLHPSHRDALLDAFRTPWVRRIRALHAPMCVLLEPALVSLTDARLLGELDATAMLEAGRPLPWRSLRAHCTERAHMRAFDDRSILPMLERLQLGEGIGCDAEETQALAVARAVEQHSQEFLHPSHVGPWLAVASRTPRRSTLLRACFEPRYTPAAAPPFVTELSLVRDDAAAPWTTLDVGAVFIAKLAHVRTGAVQWLEAAIESARPMPIERVRLGVTGDKCDAQRARLEAAIVSAFGSRFERE
jgi:hypothetical protein